MQLWPSGWCDVDKPTPIRALEQRQTWPEDRVQALMDVIKTALENDEAIFVLSVRREYSEGGADTTQTSDLFRSSRSRVSQAEVFGALSVELAQWAAG